MPRGNVIVFGYDELLLAALDIGRAAGLNVRAVVFPENRLNHPYVAQIRAHVERHRLPTLVQPKREATAPFVAELASLQPDLMLVWSYSMILPPSVLAVPRLGGVNLHLGLLPEYRGAQAMVWSLVNGESHTGVTLHYLETAIDSGPIIDRVQFPIRPEDDIVALMIRGKEAGGQLLRKWLPQLVVKQVPATPQDESRACLRRPWDTADADIDWSADPVAICNLVRATVAPFPGAYTWLAGQRVVVRKARVITSSGLVEPGTVYEVDARGWHVAAGCGGVLIEVAEIDGRKYTVGQLRSTGIRPGERFERACGAKPSAGAHAIREEPEHDSQAGAGEPERWAASTAIPPETGPRPCRESTPPSP